LPVSGRLQLQLAKVPLQLSPVYPAARVTAVMPSLESCFRIPDDRSALLAAARSSTTFEVLWAARSCRSCLPPSCSWPATVHDGLVDCHRSLILLFRWLLHSSFYTLPYGWLGGLHVEHRTASSASWSHGSARGYPQILQHYSLV
jgi:hypothetical protein